MSRLHRPLLPLVVVALLVEVVLASTARSAGSDAKSAAPVVRVAALLPWAFLQGAGFGACWSFLIRRLVQSVPEGDRERASSSVPTLQRLGYALGAAGAGIVVNLTGLSPDAPRAIVETASFWVFAAFLPAAAAGVWAAWKVSAAPHGSPFDKSSAGSP